MEQEAMFLAALRTTASVLIDGALLRLAHADGALIFEPLGTQGADAFVQETLPEALAQQAELIILGETVGPQTSARVLPGSPLAPPEPPGEPAHAEPPSIYTETQVRVERALKGAAPDDSIRVRTLGGSVDGLAMAMTHTPQLHVDQRVVLVLKQIEPGYFVVLGEDGVYVIADDIATGPRHQVPLSELLKRIEDSGAN